MRTATLIPETFRVKYNPYRNLKPRIRDFKLIIYEKLGISEDDADAKCRNFELVEARQIAQAMCYKYKDRFGWNLRMIGKEIGGQDHATVIHSKKIADCHYQLEKDYADRFDRIERIIRSRFNIK